MATSGPDGDRHALALKRLRDGAIGAFVLLAIQNGAGILLNLYVSFDDTGSYGGVFPALFGSPAGIVHFLGALGLFIGGIVQMISARQSRDSRLLGLSVVAFLALIVAAYSGYHFIYSTGGSATGDPTYSFLMEMGFLVIVLCEAAILALVPGRRGTGPLRPVEGADAAPA